MATLCTIRARIMGYTLLFTVLQLLVVTAIGHSVLTSTVCLGTGEYRGSTAISTVLSAISLGYRCVDTAHGATLCLVTTHAYLGMHTLVS